MSEDHISKLPGPDRYGYSEARTARNLQEAGWSANTCEEVVELRASAPVSSGVVLEVVIRYDERNYPKVGMVMTIGAYAVAIPAPSIRAAIDSATYGSPARAILKAMASADPENVAGIIKITKALTA